jgi:hypothetical protein
LGRVKEHTQAIAPEAAATPATASAKKKP